MIVKNKNTQQNKMVLRIAQRDQQTLTQIKLVFTFQQDKMKKHLFFCIQWIYLSLNLTFSLELQFLVESAKTCLTSENFYHVDLIFNQLSTDSDIGNLKDSFKETNSFFFGINKR